MTTTPPTNPVIPTLPPVIQPPDGPSSPSANDIIEALPPDLRALATTGFCPAHFHDLRWVLLGACKAGKSVLAQSDPHSIVLCWERGTGYEAARSVILPNPRTSRTGMTWELYQRTFKALIERGLAGKPVCRRVVFDTYPAFVGAVDRATCAELTEESRRRAERAKSPGAAKVWTTLADYGTEGAGYAMWAAAAFAPLLMLEEAGYAWTVIMHVNEKVRQVRVGGSDIGIVELKPNVFPSLFDLVSKRADYTAILTKGYVAQRGTKKTPDGKEIPDLANVKYIPQVRIAYRTVGPGEPEKLCGSRIDLPEIVLPLEGGWAAIQATYEQAVAEKQARIAAAGPAAAGDPHV